MGYGNGKVAVEKGELINKMHFDGRVNGIC